MQPDQRPRQLDQHVSAGVHNVDLSLDKHVDNLNRRAEHDRTCGADDLDFLYADIQLTTVLDVDLARWSSMWTR